MIPAKTVCPSPWTREYYGYLTAEADSFYRSSFECIDNSPEVLPGSSRHMNGALFSTVEYNAILDWTVLHMRTTGYSPVLCALSRVYNNTYLHKANTVMH